MSLQGASGSMTPFSPERVVMFSGSGIAVRALLLATSLPLTMVLPRVDLSVSTFSGWFAILEVLVLKCQGSRSPGLLRFSRSALGSGVSVQLSPFRGCLSGSSEHGRGSVSSSGHPAGVFFCLIARLRPGLGLALAFLGNPCLGFQWLSFRERVQSPLLSSW